MHRPLLRDAGLALYGDGGTSYGCEKGKGTTTRLHWNDASGTLDAVGGDAAFDRKAAKPARMMGK